MTAEDGLRLIANITILAIGFVLLAFIVGYGIFFNWRKTPGGRSVMYFVGSLELLILLAAFLNWVHVFQEETEQLLRLEVFVAILVAAGRMFYVLVTRWRTTGTVSIDVDLKSRRQPDEPDTRAGA
jgi:hypothetical protein